MLNNTQTEWPRLTKRQREVLGLLLRGKSEERIGEELGLSRHTVHNHVKALHRSFDVSSRSELFVKCADLLNVQFEVVDDGPPNRRAPVGSKPPLRVSTADSTHQQILESVADDVAQIDPGGTIRFINHGAKGFAPQDIVGKSIFDLVHPDDRAQLEQAVRKVVERGETATYRGRTLGADGQHYSSEIRLSPFTNGDGGPSSVVLVCRSALLGAAGGAPG